jgi:hypothetical protein
MTLQQAKDQVAKKHRFKDWEDVVLQFQAKNHVDEAAELYAKSKWDEACNACAELVCVENIGTDGEAYILNNKPEFKP